MKHVDLYGRVRHAVLVDGMSRREAARLFGINRRTVEKMLMFSIPPGYRRDKEIRRPKLDDFIGILDQILEADKLVPKKQRHTSKRILRKRYWGQHLWARGYWVASSGNVTDEVWAEYIRNQTPPEPDDDFNVT